MTIHSMNCPSFLTCDRSDRSDKSDKTHKQIPGPLQVGWILAHGPIPSGQHVLRTCGNPYCCRPSHMRVGIAGKTTPDNLRARFLAKTQTGPRQPHMASNCLIWNGSREGVGYGIMTYQGRPRMAHHVAWYLETGEWPPRDKVIMHACDQRNCVNIDHLSCDTRAANVADCVRKGRNAKGPSHGSRTKPESVRKGVRNGRAKITEPIVVQIRRTVAAHPERHGVLQALATKFGLNAGTVSDIASEKLWKHIPADAMPELSPIPVSLLSFGKKRGEQSPHAKVSDATIEVIRVSYAQASKKWGMISRLARVHGLSPSHVHRIVNGNSR